MVQFMLVCRIYKRKGAQLKAHVLKRCPVKLKVKR
jgi:hypothetical protein